jgi:Barstar (barnase inhibitor)
MDRTARVRVAALLPGLSGRGVLLAAPADAERVRRTLAGSGFAMAEVAGPAAGMREAQAAIARALRLPEAAGRNLDALVDSLRDLATWWPDDDRVVLFWPGAEQLVEGDLPGFLTLTEILRGATDELWRGGGPGDRQFETVAFVRRHGVRALGEAPA